MIVQGFFRTIQSRCILISCLLCLGHVWFQQVLYIICIWMFPKIVVPPIIHFNRGFHYKPSILGYPYFWKHPYVYNVFLGPILRHLHVAALIWHLFHKALNGMPCMSLCDFGRTIESHDVYRSRDLGDRWRKANKQDFSLTSINAQPMWFVLLYVRPSLVPQSATLHFLCVWKNHQLITKHPTAIQCLTCLGKGEKKTLESSSIFFRHRFSTNGASNLSWFSWVSRGLVFNLKIRAIRKYVMFEGRFNMLKVMGWWMGMGPFCRWSGYVVRSKSGPPWDE